MDERVIVIYTSKRGTTKQYAEWIAEELDCACVPMPEADLDSLDQYEVIIYGSWLRGSGIVDFDKLAPHLEGLKDRTILFVTGISEYNPENYMQICDINFKGFENMDKMKLFFCPGRYDPANVKGLDKMLMGIAKRVLRSGKTPDGASAADAMIDAIEHGTDQVDRKYIRPIVGNAKNKLEPAAPGQEE